MWNRPEAANPRAQVRVDRYKVVLRLRYGMYGFRVKCVVNIVRTMHVLAIFAKQQRPFALLVPDIDPD